MEYGLCRSGRTRPPRVESLAASAGLIIQDSRPGLRGKTVPLSYQEPIGCDAKCGVMVKSAPASAFKVTQAQFLLQFLIVALNDPAMFRHLDHSLEIRLKR
jgi:hypothetical protein